MNGSTFYVFSAAKMKDYFRFITQVASCPMNGLVARTEVVTARAVAIALTIGRLYLYSDVLN
jgi:hypothetical protein